MRSDVRGLVSFIGITLLAAVAPRPTAAATVSFNGYVKNFFVVEDPATLSLASDPGRDLEYTPPSMTANNVRIRLNVAAEVSSWLGLDVSYNVVPRVQDDDAAALGALIGRQVTPAYRIDDLRSTLWPSAPDAGDNVVVQQNLDRLFATVIAPLFDLYVGRQAIAWGSARAVNPTDVIAPYLYTEIDTEDRIGVDAIRLRAPVGALGELDVGYIAGADADWEDSAAYVRGKSYAGGIDYSLIAMRFRENVLVGADATFAIMGAGAWIEAAGVAIDQNEFFESADDSYLRVTAGLDYSFHNGTYGFVEYHYNGAGGADADEYGVVAGSRAYSEGGVYLLGRHYVIPGVSYPISLVWNVGGSVLANLGDGSLLLAPTVEYNVLENAYLSAGAFVGFGDQARLPDGAGVAGDALLDPTTLDFDSEFGAYSDVYFISARYYF